VRYGAAPVEIGIDGTISVVIADDDVGYLESLRMLVEQQPSLTVAAVALDGLEAIECVDEIDPDAVVIDLHMPRLDGVSAVARIRQDHPSICLIAITGDDDPELHRAVEEAGADAVLVKGDLVGTLQERLAAVRQRAVM
jgi:DNA-binding NarL/FixJ family response regulator